MLVIAGLGNPGSNYENNRHNIGFMAVDSIHSRHGFSPWRAKFRALIAEGRVAGEKLLLVKPQTYMNHSGQALAAVLGFYKLNPADMIIIHDELDIAAGKIRIKTGGSSGGHNGIKSLDAHCGADYRRLRLGIGRPCAGKERVRHHVMGDFAKAEQAWLEPLLAAIGNNIGLLVQNDANGFMNKIFTETHDTSGNNGHAKTGADKRAAKPANAAAVAPKSPAGTMAEKLKKLFGGKKGI